jgi:4a-hydroxytetrahydrobiopterin dehydratase
MTQKLTELKCVPCRGDSPKATDEEIAEYRKQIPEWEIITVDGVPRLRHQYAFKNFVQALAFTNQVGGMAEEEDHHPALLTEWGKVTVSWWTHAIQGLHQNDFVAAAKTDQIYAAAA